MRLKFVLANIWFRRTWMIMHIENLQMNAKCKIQILYILMINIFKETGNSLHIVDYVFCMIMLLMVFMLCKRIRNFIQNMHEYFGMIYTIAFSIQYEDRRNSRLTFLMPFKSFLSNLFCERFNWVAIWFKVLSLYLKWVTRKNAFHFVQDYLCINKQKQFASNKIMWADRITGHDLALSFEFQIAI